MNLFQSHRCLVSSNQDNLYLQYFSTVDSLSKILVYYALRKTKDSQETHHILNRNS